MTTLSTHVLDTSRGMPATNVRLVLNREGKALWDGATDSDGRCPDLAGLTLEAGRYLLEFAVADYFRGIGTPLADPPFLDVVVIEFGIAGEGHYHVPLLLSPYGYSTYRGS